MKKGRGNGFLNFRRNWKSRNFLVCLYLPSDFPVDGEEKTPYGELAYFNNGILKGCVRLDSDTVILRDNEHPELRFNIQRDPHAKSKKGNLRYDISVRGRTKVDTASWRRAVRHIIKICRIYSSSST